MPSLYSSLATVSRLMLLLFSGMIVAPLGVYGRRRGVQIVGNPVEAVRDQECNGYVTQRKCMLAADTETGLPKRCSWIRNLNGDIGQIGKCVASLTDIECRQKFTDKDPRECRMNGCVWKKNIDNLQGIGGHCESRWKNNEFLDGRTAPSQNAAGYGGMDAEDFMNGLIGLNADDARRKIHQELNIPGNDGYQRQFRTLICPKTERRVRACNDPSYRNNRIRLFVDGDNQIIKVPGIG